MEAQRGSQNNILLHISFNARIVVRKMKSLIDVIDIPCLSLQAQSEYICFIFFRAVNGWSPFYCPEELTVLAAQKMDDECNQLTSFSRHWTGEKDPASFRVHRGHQISDGLFNMHCGRAVVCEVLQ